MMMTGDNLRYVICMPVLLGLSFLAYALQGSGFAVQGVAFPGASAADETRLEGSKLLRGATRRLQGGDYFNFNSDDLMGAEAGFVGGVLFILLLAVLLCCCCCRRGCSLWDLLACVCLYEICCDDRSVGDFQLM
jgi:hypothetical protein